MSLSESAEKLVSLLERSLDGIRSPAAISFSGGLDSSVVAAIAMKRMKLTGYSVGIAGSYDLGNAEKSASSLGLELKKIELSEKEVLSRVPTVKKLTGLEDRLNVSIAIPLYDSCSAAASDGFVTILCGQGADELFAGYARYEKMGKAELKAALEKDFLALENGGWKRDLSIAKAAGIVLVSPFMDTHVSDFARALPVEFKYDGKERKVILRTAARLLGLDPSVSGQKKKAMQYGSGVAKVLEKRRL